MFAGRFGHRLAMLTVLAVAAQLSARDPIGLRLGTQTRPIPFGGRNGGVGELSRGRLFLFD